jgi:O-succinylbenzoate synthase
MRIERVVMRLIKLSLLHPFETSFGIDTERTIILVTLFSNGMEGWSESVMDPFPLFREETIEGAWNLIKDGFSPQILGHEIQNPQALIDLLAPFRGNQQAKAVLEMAYWDLWARMLNIPLHKLLGGNKQVIPVGVSLGIQKSIESTLELVQQHTQQGYKRIKLKIKPRWDVELVSRVRKQFPDIVLTVDANSAYALSDLDIFRALDSYRLDYIEQPLAYDDLFDHAKLQSKLNTSLCLDESILNASDARKSLELDACRVINIKVARVGGLQSARQVHDVAFAFGVPVWCGGMLESGIGRAHNIHLATLPNFSKPGDTSSSSRYWSQDIINEPLEAVDGMMAVPPGPGIGVSINLPLIDSLSLKIEVIKK